MQNLNFVRYSRYSISRFRALNNLKNSFFYFSSTPSEDQTSPIRPDPPPIRVALTGSAGRGVFSTRRIVAGETIHSDKPVLSHPSLSAAENVCHLCLRRIHNPKNFHDRALNSRVSFCGADCEEQAKGFYGVEVKSDWLAYDDYCRSRGLKYPLLVKRFACMVISGAASSDRLDILQPSSLSTQMVSEMEEGFHLLNSAFRESNVPDQKMAFMTKEWYIGVLARIRINAFRIELIGGLFDDLLSAAAASVEAEAAVGNAVYMLTSFYNHDCDPNVHITWIDNADAKLTALREVEEGEELRICYIDASMSRDSRQTILSQGFGFQCNCLRCLSGE